MKKKMTRVTGCLMAMTLFSLGAQTAEFQGVFPAEVERVWPGAEYWTNPLQDWRIAGGRLECVSGGENRNVHVLTRQLGEQAGELKMSVRLGRLGEFTGKPDGSWAGFRIGAKGRFGEYRDNAIRGVGFDAGVTGDGQLFVGATAPKTRVTEVGVSRKRWQVSFTDTQEAGVGDPGNAIDGDPDTYWHTQFKAKRTPYPHELRIDLGAEVEMTGFAYLPRQDQATGRFKEYEFYVSADGKEWGEPAATGAFKDGAQLQRVTFEKTAARHVRLVGKSEFANRPAMTVAELYVLGPDSEKSEKNAAPPAPALPTDELELRLTAKPAGDVYEVALAAHDAKSGKLLRSVSRKNVPADRLVGNLALVAHTPTGAKGKPQYWFLNWNIAGDKVEAHDDQVFGPILFAQHTLSRGVLTMMAQLPPVGKTDGEEVRLQILTAPDKWETIAKAAIHPLARTATFRVAPWNSKASAPYRLAYELREADGQLHERYFQGTIRRDPVEKETIVVAGFTGNADYAFPNTDLVEHVQKHDPDFLFFSGDNIYENVGGFGIQRGPVEIAALDYLRKWYIYGWAFRDLVRDRPAVSIPDDHDVYQGNVWGAGGRQTEKDDKGGYVMPAEWVNVVQRTQTSNLPAPFDPTPCEQDIAVYYTDIVYGGISFAVVEDRKFKSGPNGLAPPTTAKRADHVIDPNFDPRTADVPEAKLLGERQLKFLREWAQDWRGAELKMVLSQTTFCNVATLSGGNRESNRLIADYDSNGWPQAGRNRALREMRRGFAFHLSGDQHLATIVHHGIDDWGDAGWSFCVPSITNFYSRAWVPLEPGQNRQPGMPDYTGEFKDGFGNKITVWGATNEGESPGKEPKWLHDRMPGYGIVRMNKQARTIAMECWPRYADPTDPSTGGQYAGWPKTIRQEDNYARRAAAYLPTLAVEGLADPVVQVIDEATKDVVYTLRIKGASYRPKVFSQGSYTVVVGDPDRDKIKTLKGVKALAPNENRTLAVSF